MFLQILCPLCKARRSQKTHNTAGCRKYEKYWALKKTFKSQKGKSPVKFNHQSFMTMEANLKKVRTELKKIKKGSCKSKKHERDDLSESDSSWSVGLGSTGELAHIANVAHETNKRKMNLIPPIR